MEQILVVDDDKDFLEAIADILKSAGYDAMTCRDPLKAVGLLEGNASFRCVVLDFRMPGLDGQDLLRLVHTKFPQVPVIICSGYLDGRESFLVREGAFATLAKPFDHQVLCDTIQRALSKSEELTPIYIEGFDLREARKTITRKLIIKALTQTEFNISRTALLLGISRQYLIRYMKRCQINY